MKKQRQHYWQQVWWCHLWQPVRGSDNNGTTPAAGDSAGTSGNESTVRKVHRRQHPAEM